MLALESIQEFLNRYSESTFRPEAENMSQDLQKRIDNKAFQSARLYQQLRYYQAAVVALGEFQQQFPASSFNEEAAYLKLESQYNLAKESVEEKQRERYLEAIAFYQQFIDTYPKSGYLKTAESMYDNARAAVAKMKETAAK